MATEEWAGFMSCLPGSGSGHAWCLENSFHLLGTPFPVAYSIDRYDLVHIGGLVVLSWEKESVFVLNPGLSAQDFIDMNGQWEEPPWTEIHEDYVARSWGYNAISAWYVERDRGRNRWDDMHSRGGDVHLSLLGTSQPAQPDRRVFYAG